MTVGKNTLTKVEGSLLQAMFSGVAKVNRTKEGRVFIDRDPDMFSYLTTYLESDRTYLPKSVDQDIQTRIEMEINYWKADMGLTVFDELTKYHLLYQKL